MKYFECVEMWCCRRIEINSINHIRNKYLQRVMKERNILQTVIRKKGNWIDHI